MKHTIRSIGLLSLGKICAGLYGIGALIFVPVLVILSIVSLFFDGKSPSSTPVSVTLLVLCVALPVAYAVMGFVIGILVALIYNLLARWFGGVEIELEARPVNAPTPAIAAEQPAP